MAKPPKASRTEAPAQNVESSRDLDARIIQALGSAEPQSSPKADTETLHVPAARPGAGRPAIPYRPMVRPALAVLTVCDDGRNDGEVIRIRTPRFVIGRTEGDLCIPIDGRISSRHVEITLQTIAGRHHRWVVTDLQSTHGLFVRVSRVRLRESCEFMVGGGRYQFDAPRQDTGGSVEALATDERLETTHGWADPSSDVQAPALTELVGNQIGNRLLLVNSEYWIGSDGDCAICRSSDPFCEPRHVRVYRTAKGIWHAENNKTANGLWVRMPQVVAESLIQFQIGEQRLRLRVK
jgi:pSer/pThr/pTyr-binding forkhead associated (FHA) protein